MAVEQAPLVYNFVGDKHTEVGVLSMDQMQLQQK
jgi:hypothetical protein